MYSNTRQRGKLVTWKDDRGYGFLQSDRARSKVFIHITDIRHASRRPQVGDLIEYNLATDESGKTKAVNGMIEGLAIPERNASLPKKQPLNSHNQNLKNHNRPSSNYRKNRQAIGLIMLPIVGLVAIAGYGFRTLLSSTLGVPPTSSSIPASPTSPTPVATPASKPSVNPTQRPPQPSSITPAEDVSATQEIPAEPNPSREIDPVEIQRSLKDPASSNYQCTGKTHCSQMTSCEEAMFYLQNCPDVQIDGNNDGVPCESQWCKW